MKNAYGRTPLLYAARQGHGPVVRPLLARRDVEADGKDKDGCSPLIHASENGQEEAVRDDIEVDWKDKNGRSPL